MMTKLSVQTDCSHGGTGILPTFTNAPAQPDCGGSYPLPLSKRGLRDYFSCGSYRPQTGFEPACARPLEERWFGRWYFYPRDAFVVEPASTLELLNVLCIYSTTAVGKRKGEK